MRKASSIGGAVLVAVALTSALAVARPYQEPGCGPAGVYGCGVPYQGPDNGPPGYYNGSAYPRPYAGPSNGPPGYYRRHYRERDRDRDFYRN
jgi:hypothetical protein